MLNVLQNPIGLSDYAMLSAGPMSNRPNGYIFSERRKRKPSELEMEDAERVHVPNFPVGVWFTVLQNVSGPW